MLWTWRTGSIQWLTRPLDVGLMVDLSSSRVLVNAAMLFCLNSRSHCAPAARVSGVAWWISTVWCAWSPTAGALDKQWLWPCLHSTQGLRMLSFGVFVPDPKIDCSHWHHHQWPVLACCQAHCSLSLGLQRTTWKCPGQALKDGYAGILHWNGQYGWAGDVPEELWSW